MGPNFSVMVVAYKRKEYILDAVKSVLNQEYEYGNIQIVVVKAFRDSTVDDFLQKSRVDILFSDTVSLGQKIAEGLTLCRGDIICLLEDDDLFSPLKIQKLYNVFNDNSDVWLAVNNYRIIDGAGTVISSPFRALERNEQEMTDSRIFSGPRYDLREMLVTLSMTFNNSRISFRRELIPFLCKLYPKMFSLVDNIPILLAISNGKSIAWISDFLSFYRLHKDNVSVNFSENERTQKLRISYTRMVEDATTIRNYFADKSKKISDYFDLLASYKMLKISMIDANRRSVLVQGLNLVRKLFRKHKGIEGFGTGLLTTRKIVISLSFVPLYLLSERFGLAVNIRFPM